MSGSDPAASAKLSDPCLVLQVACEYGMVRVVSETGGPEGKDYCVLYNPQWAHLPHDLGKAVSARRGSRGGRSGHRGCWGLRWPQSGPITSLGLSVLGQKQKMSRCSH